MNMENPNDHGYSTDDFKVVGAPKKPKLNIPEPEIVEEKEVTFFDGVKIMGLIAFGYLAFSILPTVFFMKALDLGFWLSQGLNVGLALIITFSLGLHKEASPEQLAKRDMRKKR